jgi:hypothetical protein
MKDTYETRLRVFIFSSMAIALAWLENAYRTGEIPCYAWPSYDDEQCAFIFSPDDLV